MNCCLGNKMKLKLTLGKNYGEASSTTIMYLTTLLILTKTLGVVANTFQQVSSTCIYWDSLQTYKDSSKVRLHCILDEQNQLGIVNVTWKLIEPGKCPYYDRISGEIHARPCDNSTGKCPTETLFSYQAVKYSACYAAEERDVVDPNDGRQVSIAACDSSAGTEKTTFVVGLTSGITICLQLLLMVMFWCNLRFRNSIKGENGLCGCGFTGNQTLWYIDKEDSERDKKTQLYQDHHTLTVQNEQD